MNLLYLKAIAMHITSPNIVQYLSALETYPHIYLITKKFDYNSPRSQNQSPRYIAFSQKMSPPKTIFLNNSFPIFKGHGSVQPGFTNMTLIWPSTATLTHRGQLSLDRGWNIHQVHHCNFTSAQEVAVIGVLLDFGHRSSIELVSQLTNVFGKRAARATELRSPKHIVNARYSTFIS